MAWLWRRRNRHIFTYIYIYIYIYIKGYATVQEKVKEICQDFPPHRCHFHCSNFLIWIPAVFPCYWCTLEVTLPRSEWENIRRFLFDFFLSDDLQRKNLQIFRSSNNGYQMKKNFKNFKFLLSIIKQSLPDQNNILSSLSLMTIQNLE